MADVMGDLLAAYPLATIEAVVTEAPPSIAAVLLDGMVLMPHAVESNRESTLGDLFEEWLIERWRRRVASAAFRESAEFEYLRAEWERGG